MNLTEFCPLTEEAVRSLLAERCAKAIGPHWHGRRQVQRWPFRGTIELWVPDDLGFQRHALATCLDMSPNGVGIRYEEDLSMGLELEIAIHQPEASLHGRAVVRHSTRTVRGDFIIGLQFVF